MLCRARPTKTLINRYYEVVRVLSDILTFTAFLYWFLTEDLQPYVWQLLSFMSLENKAICRSRQFSMLRLFLIESVNQLTKTAGNEASRWE